MSASSGRAAPRKGDGFCLSVDPRMPPDVAMMVGSGDFVASRELTREERDRLIAIAADLRNSGRPPAAPRAPDAPTGLAGNWRGRLVTMDEAEEYVRLIVQSFRDASEPSVDIAVEEILRTVEPWYIAAVNAVAASRSQPAAPTWFCNKCGRGGQSETLDMATAEHSAKSPECDYMPAWNFKPAYDSKPLRDAINAAITESQPAATEAPDARPEEVICFSGSTRFLDRMAVEMWEAEKRGAITLGCHLLPASYTTVGHHLAEELGVDAILDEVHLRKIDMADRLVVINVGGYIGESTRREIAYAESKGKPVSYLEGPPPTGRRDGDPS